MIYEDEQRVYRQKVLAKINEKTEIKEQKRLEKRLKEKEQFAKERLEIKNKEIARLKKKFPNEELAISYNGYVLPLLKSSGIAQQRIYEKFNERFPTREAYRKKQKSKWYEKRKKAGLIKEKPTIKWITGKEYIEWKEKVRKGIILFDESQKRDGFANWYKRTRILEKDITIGKDGSKYRKNK